MPLILSGATLSKEILANASAHARISTERSGRAPALAAVAVESERLYFDVKQRAFASIELDFIPHILPPDTTTADLAKRVASLNDDPRVHGIYVQYPMPESIDVQAVCDTIALSKDVDGARVNNGGYATWGPPFPPATAEAVVRLLVHHGIPLRDQRVCIVRGDAIFANALKLLFEREGARPCVCTLDAVSDGSLRDAAVVVAATGVINGLDASRFADDVAAVDVGYYHGGGRGDIAVNEGTIARMRAYAPPQGAIGPLTIAILAEHTIAAAG